MLQVLRLAANHDGDSDSTASIAGQIYGVMTGMDEIPHEWVRRLDVVDALCLTAQAAAGLAGPAQQKLPLAPPRPSQTGRTAP